MDSQAQLLVRDEGGKYLLLETLSKKLLLPSTRVKEDEDFQAAALRYITEVPFRYRCIYHWLAFLTGNFVLQRLLQDVSLPPV